MAILGGISKCKGAGLCRRFLGRLSQAQLIAYVAEGCSKMGIESWERRARGYRIQLLSLQTLHQAVPWSLPILNSSASILHGVKELECFLPEKNIFPWLLKGREVLYKDRLKSRRLFQVPPVQRLHDVHIYFVVRCPDAGGAGFAAPIAKVFSIQAMQNPGITQKMNGNIRAQAMCPGGSFPCFSPDWG